MEDKIIFVGPFLGDWKEEIITFRPYIRFIWESLPHKKFIVSSHYNRNFLYDWADEFIPIERSLTENEPNQKKYIHKEVSQKEYFKKVKSLKEKIYEKNNFTKKEVLHYNVPYVKISPPLSIYQKSFTPIQIENNRVEEQEIVYIPDQWESEDKLKRLYKKISKDFNTIIVGDGKCHLQEMNNLNVVQYIDEVYKYIIEYINKAKLVVTPCSHWTFLCNLQGAPVFSWGKFISPYKKGGEYSFENTNMVVPDMNVEKLYEQILSFMEKIDE